MTIHDYSTGEMPADNEPAYNTAEMQELYKVLGFAAPFVIVERKSDGVRGTLQFNHSPRVYWGFLPDSAVAG